MTFAVNNINLNNSCLLRLWASVAEELPGKALQKFVIIMIIIIKMLLQPKQTKNNFTYQMQCTISLNRFLSETLCHSTMQCKVYWGIRSHISITSYNQVCIHATDGTEATWSQQNCPNFETTAQGDLSWFWFRIQYFNHCTTVPLTDNSYLMWCRLTWMMTYPDIGVLLLILEGVLCGTFTPRGMLDAGCLSFGSPVARL